MNYLSHYYFERNNKNHLEVFGCILPDIIRFHDRKLRIREVKNIADFTPKNAAIQRGVNRHHLIDRVFHNEPYFYKEVDTIQDLFEDAKLESIPKYLNFYAHILFEIVLDKILLVEYPNIGIDFYNNLDKVNDRSISNFLTKKGYGSSIPGFLITLEKFKTTKFLLQYKAPACAAYSLSRVASNVHKYNVSVNDFQKIDRIIIIYEQGLKIRYKSIFDGMALKVKATF